MKTPHRGGTGMMHHLGDIEMMRPPGGSGMIENTKTILKMTMMMKVGNIVLDTRQKMNEKY